MLFSTACGNTSEAPSGDTNTGSEVTSTAYDYSDTKIGVVGFFESGENLDAVSSYMDSLSAEVGFEYEYVAGSSYDEQTNITIVQNLIASGCDGIILCMDSGTEAIIEECEAAGVYVAGFLTDMDSSFDSISDSPYYLGTVCDGYYDNSAIGVKAAELIIEDGKKNVGITTFPLAYYPGKAQAIDAFKATIDEYNATATEPITYYDVEELKFTQLEDTYFQKYPDLDAIFNLASGFVYPTIVKTGNEDKVTLYQTGYKKDDVDAINDGSIRMMTLSNTEAIIYPTAMILNKVAEKPYADAPETAERVDTSVVYITNPDEANAFIEKGFFSTNDMEDAFVDAEEFKEYLTVYNEDATYESLLEELDSMSMEDIMAK